MVTNSETDVYGVALGSLTRRRIENYLKDRATIFVAFGATEQHGLGLPVGADAIIAEELAQAAASRTGFPYLLALPIGLSAFHTAFRGTVSLTVEAYAAATAAIIRSLANGGFRRQIVVNAHFENSGVIRAVCEEVAASEKDLAIAICDFWDMPGARSLAQVELKESGGHADAADAALLMHLVPTAVYGEDLLAEWPSVSAILSPDHAKTLITSSGVIGSNQRLATAEFGKRYFETIVDDIVERAIQISNIEAR